MGDSLNCPGGDLSLRHFTGDQHDYESNLEHTLFRKYSSTQGRWTMPDPAGIAAVDPNNPQSWNRYAYVLNNPLSLTDPTGLDCVYLNGSGDRVESIDSSSDAQRDCGSQRGYWIQGYVPNSSFVSIFSDSGLVSGFGIGAGGLEYSVAGAEGSNTWGAWTQTWGIGAAGTSSAANNDSWAWTFTKSFFSWQPQKDAWNKGYYKCLGKKTASGATAPVVTHAVGVAATNAAESGASTIAGAYYHFTDGRFTAWGKYSEVLVP